VTGHRRLRIARMTTDGYCRDSGCFEVAKQIEAAMSST